MLKIIIFQESHVCFDTKYAANLKRTNLSPMRKMITSQKIVNIHGTRLCVRNMYVCDKFDLESFYNMWTDRPLSTILPQQIWNRRIKQYPNPTLQVTLDWGLWLLRECFERFHLNSDTMFELKDTTFPTFMVFWRQSVIPQNKKKAY